ncbi:hypothetical protein LPJ66_005304 [Kickxella alabastrina]|uniref:Uncharacterized protein n=1 Tax=Kickxella alabastrina TaxID=61397 RepID=A0ACC1IIQ3_9FUNG|nr:hypothetical protein LPJ66_005304 [Kickxella alabastrina]
MLECPKCTRQIEAFSVDTNCAFRMCTNPSCTWPFEAPDMAQYFDYDATVPSMRKLAKKRKAHGAKDDQQRLKAKKPKAPETLSPPPVVPVKDSLIELPSWLSDLCEGNNDRATLSNSSLRASVDTSMDIFDSGKYIEGANTTGGVVGAAVGENSEKFHGSSSGDRGNLDIDASDAWIQSLLTTPLPPPPSTTPHRSDDGKSGSLFADNVADIFAAFGQQQQQQQHASAPLSIADSVLSTLTASVSRTNADAGVPRHSRQNSPNSESGTEEIDSRMRISEDDFAMIIDEVMKPKAPAGMLDTLVATSAAFDPISMLLSPPNSAAVAGSGSLDVLGHYYWPSVSSTGALTQTPFGTEPDGLSKSASQLPFDFDLFNVVPATMSAPTAVATAITAAGNGNQHPADVLTFQDK